MTENNLERKLRAILSADVKGYSLLMADDEIATIQTITSYRKIMKSMIEQHNGRVVDSPGDNLLAEFQSVVDAVQCAVEIQKELKSKNDELPSERRMDFRIGINLGDIVQEGDRIYGDGVNIAARIESKADPGGISISGTAFDNVRNKLGYGYEYTGEQKVKNIANPVRLYKIIMDPDAAGKVIGEKQVLGQTSRKVAITVILALAIIAGGLISYYIYLHQSGRIEPASIQKMAYPLPDNPSIVILPFENLSADKNQEYFCDGLTMDVIAALSKVPDLFVIARDTTFTFKGKPLSIKQVAEEMGVQYVLHGSVRKDKDKIRITVLLSDALKGNHLWTERYDRNLKDTFALQDDITMNVLTALQVELTEGEKIRVLTKSTNNLDAYQKWVKGRAHMLRFNIEDNLIGRQLLEEAIALDANFCTAYVDLAWTHIMELYFGSSKSPRESMGKASELAKKAVSVDETSPFAQSLLGVILTMRRQYDEAIAQGEKAVSLSPSYSLAQAQLGRTLMYSGRFEEALSWFERAIRLDPIPKNWFITAKGICFIHTGKYDEAVEQFNKVLRRNPKDLTNLTRLAMVYSLMEQEEEARKIAAEILRLNPKFSVERVAKQWPYKYEKDRELGRNALRKAGLPE